MATQGMFSGLNKYEADLIDQANRRAASSANVGTGWQAITSAAGRAGGMIGQAVGRGLGGVTTAEQRLADFQNIVSSVPDFDPMNPESLQAMSSAMWRGGFYDQAQDMLNTSQSILKDNALIDLYAAQAKQASTPKAVKREMKKGADGFYRYTDGEKERVFPELETPIKDRPMKKGADGFLRFTDGEQERVFPNIESPDKERQVRIAADGYYRYTDGDKERVFPDVVKPEAKESFSFTTPTEAEAASIARMADEEYDFGAFDFDLWGFGDKKDSISSDEAIDVIIQKVHNLAKNSNKIFGEVLLPSQIIKRYPNPADLMAVKIGSGSIPDKEKEEEGYEDILQQENS